MRTMSDLGWRDVHGAAVQSLASKQTVLRAARSGKLRGYKINGKLWRFRAEDIDAWIMRAATPVLIEHPRHDRQAR